VPASLVVRHHRLDLPRLQFPSVRTAAQLALKFAESGAAIPTIVDDHDGLIWEYPGGDPTAESVRIALSRLRVLAGLTAQ
jgi:hypothetical protein